MAHTSLLAKLADAGFENAAVPASELKKAKHIIARGADLTLDRHLQYLVQLFGTVQGGV